MKKKITLLLVFSIIFPVLLFGQGETSNWYFGNNAGIRFNNDGSITPVTDGQLDTFEGCATISDPSGDLLFYTDGINVYDRNHNLMQNGSGLYGDPSMIREGTTSDAPSSPQISGITSGKTSREYDYSFISYDPTDDNVFYYIEWGDGEIEEWIGPYNSGEQIIISHSWSKDGSYSIRTKAKDVDGKESGWSVLEISMPKIKIFDNLLFERLLTRFPFLKNLFNYINY